MSNQKINSKKIYQFSFSSRHLLQFSIMYDEVKKKDYITKNVFCIIGIIKDHNFDDKENNFSMKFGLLDLCGLGYVLRQFANGNVNFDINNFIAQIIQILDGTNDKLDYTKILKTLSLYTNSIETFTKFSDSSKSAYIHSDTNNKITKSFYLRKQPPSKDKNNNIIKNTYGMTIIINDGKNKRTSPTINIDSERAYSLGKSIEILHEKAFKLQLEPGNMSITNKTMII